MIKSNKVKALQREGKPAFGTWITLCPHPRVVKILATSGFDFVIIEMEHTDFNMETVGMLSMYARECGLTPIVRPPGTLKPHDLTRPLDAGAQGLLLPSVETAEQFMEIVRGTRYYPIGSRPMNLRGPHTDYFAGDPKQMLAHLNSETMLIVMVETQKAIANLDAILKTGAVDCVMIGPDDLSQDLGIPAEMQNPILHEAYEKVFAICKANGVPYGLSAQSPEMAESWVAKGCTWIPYQNDAAMVLNAARAVVPKLMKAGGRA
ncbi:aldolase/citrate lyase family protein [Rhodoplanes sp. TEM]|uniref:Aldolase/citrate lyase family protein n=1 Tax=Rhodoplanes tepidamans TaxID=200616 RepID=A0ABT5JFY1_RHOTP|nr:MULTISPECIES: aldolase/citrate lyase family protein [Rhodoplanes]MDC7788522.1 aldolase/citrate lyase family protein [Rhodoplanes tepidamans]MDC7985121.1 aldolase/citrate lyase family protein [Rhodoplanes sp. TEM]MDQ0353419.1 2-keto-3-deoxy-L-rhamnonate aldolase RhmA [Rhodoplanes tepidamans]